MIRVLIEVRQPPGGLEASAEVAREFQVSGFEIDEAFQPIPVPSSGNGMGEDGEVAVLRGTVENEAQIEELRQKQGVVAVWRDTTIAPFTATAEAEGVESRISIIGLSAADCPFGSGMCDCNTSLSRGDFDKVAEYLGVKKIWAKGHKGKDIIVGVVDGGINAIGRTQQTGEIADVRNVIGGWPEVSWGTTASAWGRHGNMSASDVLAMAPEAKLYDIRISDGNAISDALQGYHWALEQYRAGKGPHILTNSWGIFQKGWDPDYATKAAHPFTRKVVELLDAGVLVLFAAGNCGKTCPDGRCGVDSGPGKSIWGANGHPRVMTVGAVNVEESYIGYSSQGPAALHDQKPDFCSISHFKGYFNPDTGTSAACPIAAGVVALLKQAFPSKTQADIRSALMTQAKNLGASGWDAHTGFGVIQAFAAYQSLSGPTAEPPDPGSKPPRTGVQFTSRVEAGQKKTWRTWGWPAAWNVYWNIIPTTPGTGSPQLDWNVTISADPDGTVTYWIAVQNLGSGAVSFEARYTILNPS